MENSKPKTQKRRFRFGLRRLLLLLLFICLVLGFSDHLQVAFHRLSLSLTSSNERYEYDIQRLVDLGHFSEAVIELENIDVDSQEALDVYHRAAEYLRGTKIPFVLSMGPSGSDAWPDSFWVKCHPDHLDRIEKMVVEGDRQ